MSGFLNVGFKVLEKKRVLDNPPMSFLKIHAPLVARERKAGQFIVLMTTENGERIPITLVDSDPKEGWILIITQAIGKTTRELEAMNVGDSLYAIVGPLGTPTHIEKFGHVVCMGGGYGTAAIIPMVKALGEAGNKVTAVLGARAENLLIMENELRAVASQVVVTTNDGSKGIKGLVTDGLKKVISDEKVDRVIAVGPVPMMEAVSEMTRPHGIPTEVSLNPIMVDGTGMCGACRVTVGGETLFACVKGPDFDGHKVDWKELAIRQKAFSDFEKVAAEQK